MALYTVVLNDLLQTDFKLMLDDYPIFDENYRNVLNEKIINHYRFREINHPSPDRFNFELRTKMFEIMSFYNPLYEKINDINFDLFNQFDFEETMLQKSDGTTDVTSENIGNITSDGTNNTKSNDEINSNNTSSGEDTQTSREGKEKITNIFNDTPGGNISIGEIESGGYMTKYDKSLKEKETDNTSTTNYNKSDIGKSTNVGSIENTTNNITNTKDNGSTKQKALSNMEYVRKMTGYQSRDNIEMLSKYANSLLNIDMLVIKELKNLFFMLY